MNSRYLQKRIFASLLYVLICNRYVACFTFRHTNHIRQQSALLKAAEESFDEEVGQGFVSRVFQVYIEDTDAYGIMYNGNYLKFYDRALYSSSEVHSVLPLEKEWSIISLEDQKFIGSPSLGSEFVIQGNLKKSPSSDMSVWDLKMTSPDGSQVFNKVSNLSVATPAKTTESSINFEHLSQVPAFEIKEASTEAATNAIIIHRDEMDAHLRGQLPLRIVLNLFERARSNLLGGPDDLRRLKEEDDIIVVVTKISDCTLIDKGMPLLPGQTVHVDTQSVVKRKGMIVECYQTLKSTCGKRLAQAKITLMMISGTTNRPTKNLPNWLLEKLTGEKIPQEAS